MTFPIENQFLKQYAQMAEQAQLTVVLLEKNFCPVWRSTQAATRWPLLDTAQGKKCILTGFDTEQIRGEIAALGFFSIPVSSGLLSSGGTRIYATPIPGYYIMQAASPDAESATGLRPAGIDRPISILHNQYRAPLTLIFSALSLLGKAVHDRLLDERWTPYLESITQNAYRLLRNGELISEYIALSNGMVTLCPRQVELYSYLHQLFEAAADLAAQVNISFTWSLPQGVLPCGCDVEQVSSILCQLLANSMRFTRPENCIHIRVSSSDGRVIITVTDHGVGMSPDVLRQAFDPFFSLGLDKSPVAGNGLGLTVAQFCAAVLGGVLALHSQEGEGTTAVLSFPVDLHPTEAGAFREEDRVIIGDRFSKLRIALTDSLPVQLW